MDRATPAGFTLIELLVTIAIVGILSAYAWPSYTDHIRRSRTVEPTGHLAALRAGMEQHYQDHRNYGEEAACGVAMPAAGYFSYACALDDDAQGFVITATGREGSSMAAFVYQIDHGGLRRTAGLPPGWGPVPQDCWVTARGGAC